MQVRPVARLHVGSLQDLDGGIRCEQGPAAGHNNRMVSTISARMTDLVLVRTSLPPLVVENVASAVLVSK
jgi:hypothetical protein